LPREAKAFYVRTTVPGDDEVKKLLIGFLLLAACARSTTEIPATRGGGAAAPAAGARPALDAFLAAIRAKDLQALGANWGDKDGPIRDSKRISRDELEKRELLLMCYFSHDSYTVLDDQAVAGGERKLTVRLTKGTLSRTTDFLLASAPERWYVRSGNIEPVRDLCSRK
jgi:hypothetical protein